MKPPTVSASPRVWLLLFLLFAALTVVAASALRGNADVLTSLPFDSPAQPTAQLSASARPTRTPRATATPDQGAFLSPLSTPTPLARAPLTLNAKVYLPLVRKDPTATPTPTPIKYGWKGISNARKLASATKANGFWGLNPDWYYDWLSVFPGAQAQSPAAITALLDAAMAGPAYVPMLWCTDDVNGGITPGIAAGLARDHPGRVWLIFNEPDNNNPSGVGCGRDIDTTYPEELYFNGSNWPKLGQYLAKQYMRYYDAIKAADPTARLFPFGSLWLTSKAGQEGVAETQIWNGFTSYLANPTAEPNRTPRPLEGIAVHAYPNHSAGCGIDITATPCFQNALVAAHKFYQGVAVPSATPNANPALTAGKPIWITEIGNLAPGGNPAGSLNGRSATQAFTASKLTQPLLSWFTVNAIPGGSVPYFNGLAWYATHDCGYNADGTINDVTASDLLDIGAIPCPIPTEPALQPTTQLRTVIGQAWATATCLQCACPGPDCP